MYKLTTEIGRDCPETEITPQDKAWMINWVITALANSPHLIFDPVSLAHAAHQALAHADLPQPKESEMVTPVFTEERHRLLGILLSLTH
jgi:hypothetical protein